MHFAESDLMAAVARRDVMRHLLPHFCHARHEYKAGRSVVADLGFATSL